MELSLPFARRVPRREARYVRRGKLARVGTLGTHAGPALGWISSNRIALRVTVAVLVALPLFGGGWLWLRDSSLVAVEHVHISGVHGAEAIAIRTALDDDALQMTTMDFSLSRLRSAVASYAIVGGLHVRTIFPHTVSISVSERPPVAALVSAGQRTAVAADGTVLGPALLSSSLPDVNASVEPSPGERLSEPAALASVTVLGAAPAPLARFVVRVYNGPEGLTVAMRNGLFVYFGNDTRPHAKWLSFARVLTSPSSAGALYIDVRLPERPAAGFSSTASSTISTPVQSSSSEPTAAALAASLANAVGGSSTTTSGSTTTAQSESSLKESETTSTSTAGSPSTGEATSSSPPTGAASSPSGSPSEASASATGEQSYRTAEGG
jgi:cell division protein FtsQ